MTFLNKAKGCHLTLKEFKATIHAKVNNVRYVFMQLTPENFEMFTEITDDAEKVPFYNDDNKIFCFILH